MYPGDQLCGAISPCPSLDQFDWDDSASGTLLDFSPPPQGRRCPAPRGKHSVEDWVISVRSPTPHRGQGRELPAETDFFRKTNLQGKVCPVGESVMYGRLPSGRGEAMGVYGDRSALRDSSLGRPSPLRANHDLGLTFPDSDSGFSSSLRTRSGGFGRPSLNDDPFSPPSQGRLMRSRSLTHLNDACEQDKENLSFRPRASDHGYRRPDLAGSDRVIKDLKDKLEDSENRRTVLMSKLKEAQKTLQAQGDRLDRIENTAKENEYVVEELKAKELEYRQKIGNLEREQDERDFLRLENMRLREDTQHRISSLDEQLRGLQSQYSMTESESHKRNSLLEQTSKALNLLEEENAKFQKERDSAVVEMKACRDSYQVIQAKCALMEEENSQVKADLSALSQEYSVVDRKLLECVSKNQELDSLVQSLRSENERLATAWENTTQDKQKLSEQQGKFDEIVSELRSQVTTATSDRQRSMQDRLELQKQQQQLITDKEHLMKSKISLEELLNEHQGEVTQARLSLSKAEEDRRRLEEELKAVKKVSEGLSTELAGAKSGYERSLEQLSILENGKKISAQQQHILEQEANRLETELQKAKESFSSKEADFKAERSSLEENLQKYKDEIRGLRVDKGQLDDKCHELETKLKRANEELHQSVSMGQCELESWRSTCERLTASVSRKEAELQSLTDKCGDLEDLVSKLKKECKVYQEQVEQCLEVEDVSDRLREDNRRLLQEKAENEQMIQLLEMQKQVLSKSSESNLDRLQEVDQLMGRMDQLRNENTLLRDRIIELERVRDSLMKQKEESALPVSRVHSSDGSQLKVSQEQNDQLQHVNQVLTKKMDKLEQENAALRLRTNTNSVPREELDRLERQKKLLEEEHRVLQQQHQELTDRHQRFVINYGHGNNTDKKDWQKEVRSLEKQLSYLQGQIILSESSKKRAEDTASELAEQVRHLEGQAQQLDGQDKSSKKTDLEKSLKESQKKRESLESLVRTLKQELLQEKKKGTSSEADEELWREVDRLTETVEDKDELIEQLNSQLQELKTQLHTDRQTRATNGDAEDKVFTTPETTDPETLPGNRSPVKLKPVPLWRKGAGNSVREDGSTVEGRKPTVSKKPQRNQRRSAEPRSEQNTDDLATQQATSKVFKPPTRQIHPRLQTLVERYKDAGDMGDNSAENTSSSTGGHWPYNKLPAKEETNPTTKSTNFPTPRKSSHMPKTRNNLQNGTKENKSEPQEAMSHHESEEVNKEGDQKTTLMDSQEQRDISSLIQKRSTFPKPTLSFAPPKITSKGVANFSLKNERNASGGICDVSL